MPWLVTGHVSLCLEGGYQQAHSLTRLSLFTSSTGVCTSFLSFHPDRFQFWTELLVYPKPDSNIVKHKEKTTQLAQKLSVGHLTQGQPRRPTLDHHADLERQLSEALTERAQLADQLAQKSALLEQAEADAAEVKKRAGLEQRDLQAKLEGLLLSRDQAEANMAEVKERAELEQRDLQAKLDDLLLSRDQALEQARSALQNAAEVNERSQQELAELHAKLEARESELAAVRL
jgi:hypothetical protein